MTDISPLEEYLFAGLLARMEAWAIAGESFLAISRLSVLVWLMGLNLLARPEDPRFTLAAGKTAIL